MERRKRHDRRAKRWGRDQHPRSPATHALLVMSTLISVCLSLVGGVVIDGWIAFETPYWQAFRSLVEGVPVGAALSLGIVLFVAAAGVGLVTALETHSS